MQNARGPQTPGKGTVSDGRRRLVVLALGLASALLTASSLITVAVGPAAVERALGLPRVIPPGPVLPIAVVSLTAGGITLGSPAPVIYPLVPVQVAVQWARLRRVEVIDTAAG